MQRILLIRLYFHEYHDVKILSRIPARRNGSAGRNPDSPTCQIRQLAEAGREANRDALDTGNQSFKVLGLVADMPEPLWRRHTQG